MISKNKLHDRTGQNSHAYGTGNGNQHVEFYSQPDFFLDCREIPLGFGCYNAGNHRGSQGRGNGYRNIGQKPIFAAVDTKKRHSLLFCQSFSRHNLPEHGIIYGAA